MLESQLAAQRPPHSLLATQIWRRRQAGSTPGPPMYPPPRCCAIAPLVKRVNRFPVLVVLLFPAGAPCASPRMLPATCLSRQVCSSSIHVHNV